MSSLLKGMNLFMLLSFRLEWNIRYVSLQRYIPILFDGLKLNQKVGYLISQKRKKERRNKQASDKFMVVTMWHVRSPGKLGTVWRASGSYSLPAWHRFQQLRQNSWMASCVHSLPWGGAKLELSLFFLIFVTLVQTLKWFISITFYWLTHLWWS